MYWVSAHILDEYFSSVPLSSPWLVSRKTISGAKAMCRGPDCASKHRTGFSPLFSLPGPWIPTQSKACPTPSQWDLSNAGRAEARLHSPCSSIWVNHRVLSQCTEVAWPSPVSLKANPHAILKLRFGRKGRRPLFTRH